MIRANILYCLLRFFILVLFVGSCSMKEDMAPYKSGIVNFVARHTDFNGKEIGTKAEAMSDFENKVHNCYFILFDDNGDRAYYKDLSDIVGQDFSQNPIASVRLSDIRISDYSSFNNCKACFIANIPSNIIQNITTWSSLAETVLDIHYSGDDIIDAENNHSFFAVPEFDLDGNDETKSVQCIPMFGMTTCNLESNDQCEIPIKRLFAKISINISVTQNLSSFDILAAHLHNLPTRVNLVEPTNTYESEWVSDESKFLNVNIEGPIDDDNISAGVDGLINGSSYEFFFYVPEYFLLPLPSTTPNYGNEKFKPKMYDKENKYPVFVKIFGIYEDKSITGSSVKADVVYDLYLGEDASTSFTHKRNVHYTNKLKINGVTNNIDGTGETLDCRVEVTTHDLVEIYGQTANCYIIGKTGKYIYPACKGVFKGGFDNIPTELLCSNSEGKELKLEVLTTDNNSIKIENLDYNPESKEFSFEITEMDSGTGAVASNDGNIILALTYMQGGEKKIEWSWHIWVVNGAFLVENAFEMTPQTYPNDYIMMDRNIGAKPTALQKNEAGIVTGLYYKYGYKEPYVNGKYWGGGESSSYTWNGDDKSQTDPCPPGYRVPKAEVWRSTDDSNPTCEHSGVYSAFKYWGSYYYPYSGYIDADGNKLSVGNINPGEIETMAEVRLPHEQNPWGTTVNYGDILRGDYPQKFMNVKYRVNDIDISGYSSARDEKLFKYWYKNKGYEIIECEFIRGTWIESKKNIGSSWFPIYISEYNASYSGNPIKLTGEQLSKDYPEEYDNLIKRIQTIKAGGVFNDFLSGIQKEVSYSLDESVDKTYGYQVRCVRE